jgi:transcriptional regulator with AAA-type ATPase domain
VSGQIGLIERAHEGRRPLFLDEVHHLPTGVQGVLLRVIEDGEVQRVGGEGSPREVDVRFVLATNDPGQLTDDLVARLREVALPSLAERVADVPAVFDFLLRARFERHGLDGWQTLLGGDHYEELCLETLSKHSFRKENVRGLIDLADRLVTRIAAGADPDAAVDTVFNERFGAGDEEQVSHYEQHKELIKAVFIGCGHNVSRTVSLLQSGGLPWRCSRRHLASYLEKWGLKPASEK